MILLLCFSCFILLFVVWSTAPLFKLDINGVCQQTYSFSWMLLIIVIWITSLFLYRIFGHEKAWHDWQAHGRAHYDLMVEVQRLGGIDGLIQGIEARLAQNPNDITGWQLLAKLYAAKQEPEKAQQALQHVAALQQANAS